MLSRFSQVWFFEIPWTVARQALLSMGFSQQEFWSGLPFPPPGNLPKPGIKLRSPTAPALQAGFSFFLFFFKKPLSYQGSPIRCYGNILKIFTYQSKVTSIKIKIIKVNQMPCGIKKKIKLKNNWDLSKSMKSSMNHNWKSKLKLYKSDV